MRWIYHSAVKLYSFLIWLVSPFSHKASLWINGRKNLFGRMGEALKPFAEKRIWFHCASLGEFEQAVPLIEQLKKKYPATRIILTFYSPSGYELKKHTAVADAVFYLPTDSPEHARRFLDIIKPEMAFFIKYEFWHFYIQELKKRNIPLYIVSARFRNNHIFFKWYGKFFLSMLKNAQHLFVQDENSLQLCTKAGLNNCSLSGDTRFDRVMAIARNPQSYFEIETFCSGKKILIAGSTWPEDEKLITELIHQVNDDWKFIIAPHEINEHHIRNLISGIRKKAIPYSQFKGESCSVLIIDNIGMLSSLYSYGHLAYVGGGLGRGLHNILEPAAYGLPVIFGNRIEKNPEAHAMIQNGTGFTIGSADELTGIFNKLNASETQLEKLHTKQKTFIALHAGAVQRIMNSLS